MLIPDSTRSNRHRFLMLASALGIGLVSASAGTASGVLSCFLQRLISLTTSALASTPRSS